MLPFFTFFTTPLSHDLKTRTHFPWRKLNYNVASTILALDSSLKSSRVKVKNISNEKSFFMVKHNYVSSSSSDVKINYSRREWFAFMNKISWSRAGLTRYSTATYFSLLSTVSRKAPLSAATLEILDVSENHNIVFVFLVKSILSTYN